MTETQGSAADNRVKADRSRDLRKILVEVEKDPKVGKELRAWLANCKIVTERDLKVRVR